MRLKLLCESKIRNSAGLEIRLLIGSNGNVQLIVLNIVKYMVELHMLALIMYVLRYHLLICTS